MRHDSFLDPCLHRASEALPDPGGLCGSSGLSGHCRPAGDFVYARLQRSVEREPEGYASADLDAWAERARIWAEGGTPEDLTRVLPKAKPGKPRDCFIYFIGSAKVRNPAAAMALIDRVAALRRARSDARENLLSLACRHHGAIRTAVAAAPAPL